MPAAKKKPPTNQKRPQKNTETSSTQATTTTKKSTSGSRPKADKDAAITLPNKTSVSQLLAITAESFRLDEGRGVLQDSLRIEHADPITSGKSESVRLDFSCLQDQDIEIHESPPATGRFTISPNRIPVQAGLNQSKTVPLTVKSQSGQTATCRLTFRLGTAEIPVTFTVKSS